MDTMDQSKQLQDLFNERSSPLIDRINVLKEKDISNDLQINALCLEIEKLKELF